MSQGLKPTSSADRNVWAKAQTYLRSKSNRLGSKVTFLEAKHLQRQADALGQKQLTQLQNNCLRGKSERNIDWQGLPLCQLCLPLPQA